MKRVLLFVILTSLVLVAYVSYCGTSHRATNEQQQEGLKAKETPRSDRKVESGDTSKYVRKDLELPAVKKGEQVIRHAGYSFVYNETYEQAAWVASELTEKETEKVGHVTNRR